jgi:hypothetical protein
MTFVESNIRAFPQNKLYFGEAGTAVSLMSDSLLLQPATKRRIPVPNPLGISQPDSIY